MDQSYEGFYARFEAMNKSAGSLLMGPDNIVGNDYLIEFRKDEGRTVVWIRNKFNAEIGFFDVEGSRKIQLAHARGQMIRVLLSFVAYSDLPDPGLYWGEMAVFCFNPAYEKEMGAFVDRIALRLAEGVRPAISFGSSSVRKIFEQPEWIPSDTVPFPKKEKGMAILKDHQSMSEKMIEQGRARNKGCYVVSWIFIAAVVIGIALVVFNFLPR